MSEEEASTADFNVIDRNPMELVISDLVILNKKEKAPPSYVAIEPPISEGGKFSFAKRYVAYSRELPNKRFGHVVLSEIKVISSDDRVPFGFRGLSESLDDNVKPFSSKLVVIKLTPVDQATEGVTDVLVLSGSKKESVPAGYKRLPEINGFSICYQISKLSKKSSNFKPPPVRKVLQKSVDNDSGSGPQSQGKPANKKPLSAIDGLNFKLNQPQDNYDSQFCLEINLLTLDDIDNKFNFDWVFQEEIAQA